jgi:hypothetical protein
LTLKEFYELTPNEFFYLCEGHAERERSEHEKRSWALAYILSALSPKRRSPKTIFDRLSGKRTREDELRDAELSKQIREKAAKAFPNRRARREKNGS